MKRKILAILLLTTLLAGAALTGCGGGGGGGGGEVGDNGMSGETHYWRIQAFTGSGTTFHVWTQNLARLITEMSGGRLTVEAFGGGEIVETFDMPNAVRDGILEGALGYSTLWTVEYGMPLFTSWPGEFSDVFDYWYWAKYGGRLDIWNDVVAPFDVKILVGGLFDTENFLWSNTPIRTVDDLKSKK